MCVSLIKVPSLNLASAMSSLGQATLYEPQHPVSNMGVIILTYGPLQQEIFPQYFAYFKMTSKPRLSSIFSKLQKSTPGDVSVFFSLLARFPIIFGSLPGLGGAGRSFFQFLELSPHGGSLYEWYYYGAAWQASPIISHQWSIFLCMIPLPEPPAIDFALSGRTRLCLP